MASLPPSFLKLVDTTPAGWTLYDSTGRHYKEYQCLYVQLEMFRLVLDGSCHAAQALLQHFGTTAEIMA